MLNPVKQCLSKTPRFIRRKNIGFTGNISFAKNDIPAGVPLGRGRGTPDGSQLCWKFDSPN